MSFKLGKGGRRAAGLLVLGFGALALARGTAMALELGPQSVVRAFCQADALGQRANGWGWDNVGSLVTWPLEPAWDQVVLIGSYTVDPPRPEGEGTLAVDVKYAVVGQLSAIDLETNVYVETVTFSVQVANAAGWRIIGPMPAPHIFANRVDVEQMRRSLQGETNFVPDSLFVWQMMRSVGWNVPFEGTGDLLNNTTYRPVERPAVGDLVVYLRDGAPYHVGLWEAENQVVSSTLNAGIVRAPLAAFAGDVRYLRLVEPDSDQAERQSIVPLAAGRGTAAPPSPPASLGREPSPKKRATTHGRSKRSAAAQHRAGRHVNKSGSRRRLRTPATRKLRAGGTQPMGE